MDDTDLVTRLVARLDDAVLPEETAAMLWALVETALELRDEVGNRRTAEMILRAVAGWLDGQTVAQSA